MRMVCTHIILFAFLLWSASAACAQSEGMEEETEIAADSLRSDTLITGLETYSLETDSTEQSISHNWLYPAGVILATGAAVLLLFTVRSR
jgi:hypothetical protein